MKLKLNSQPTALSFKDYTLLPVPFENWFWDWTLRRLVWLLWRL